MNRSEFIKVLRRELSKLPQEEIDAAVAYYEEYFDEVGPGRDAEAIQDFGSPKKIAAQIKSEYTAKKLDEGEVSTAKKGVSVIWLVILGICSAPISVPVAALLVALVICAFAVVLAVVVSVFAALIGAVAAGIVMVAFGILAIPTAFSTVLMFVGGGVLLLAVSSVIGVFVVLAIKKAVSAIVKSIRMRNERTKAERKCVV